MSELPPTNLEEEIISESSPVGLPWRLLVFSLVIFGFSFSVYFGLKFGYAAYLNDRTRTVDKQITDLANQVSKEDQKKFVDFYSQLVNLKSVMERHVFSANLFSFLERNTLANIYYTNAEFIDDRRMVNVKGAAQSLADLVGQLNIFEKSAELENIVLDYVNFNEGKVGFGAMLTFKESFFKLPKE